MAIAIASLMLGLAALPAGKSPLRNVVVAHSLVRLGDLVDLTSVPERLRRRATLIEIARVQNAPLIVTRSFLLQRIRVQVPQLAAWGETHVTQAYTIYYRSAALTKREGCLRALRDVAEGDVLRSENFVIADCEKARTERSYRYVSAERAVRSRRPIAAGTILPRFAGYGVTNVYPGDRMAFVVSVGPVKIEREISALQSARQNEQMFVRTDDGDILSMPYAGAGQ